MACHESMSLIGSASRSTWSPPTPPSCSAPLWVIRRGKGFFHSQHLRPLPVFPVLATGIKMETHSSSLESNFQKINYGKVFYWFPGLLLLWFISITLLALDLPGWESYVIHHLLTQILGNYFLPKSLTLLPEHSLPIFASVTQWNHQGAWYPTNEAPESL